MQKFVEIMGQYFLALDKGVVVAGLLMLMMFVLIVYVLSIAAIAFRKRKEAVSISLPDIESDEISEDGIQFKEPEDISIELIDPEEDDVIDEGNVDNEEAFLTSLVLETGQFISKENSEISMPQVGEFDEQAVLKRKEAKRARERERIAKEREQELKSIAKADEKAEADEAEKALSELMEEITAREADGD